MEKALAALEQLKPLIDDIYLNNEVEFRPKGIVTEDVQVGYYEANREGEVIDWHEHPETTEYLIIVKGAIKVEIKRAGQNPKEIYYKKDVCIINPGVKHKAEIIESPLIMIFITIPPEKLYAGEG